jgi:tRNA pseudouridine38-40 synthase
VDSNFHPLKSVANKEYRYFIWTGEPNIWQRKHCWEYDSVLKIKDLNEILKIFRGQHNFFNFCYCRFKNQSRINTIRQINSLKSWRRKKWIIISVIAPSFLRYQIRTIIGEAVNCYEGKQSIDDLKNKLTNFTDSSYKYKNIAPSSGLYLWKINYRNL